MKATYKDFLTTNPTCSKFSTNPDAIAIFDFLNQDDIIIRMIDYCDMEKPALSACVLDLETFVAKLPKCTISLSDSFTRTVIGRMVKSILAPFGYRPTSQKAFSKTCVSKYFSSASCYNLDGPATLKVVKRIEKV